MFKTSIFGSGGVIDRDSAVRGAENFGAVEWGKLGACNSNRRKKGASNPNTAFSVLEEGYEGMGSLRFAPVVTSLSCIEIPLTPTPTPLPRLLT